MRLFEIAALAACLFNFALATFVLWQDYRAALHRAYFAWGMGLAIWNLSCYYMYGRIGEEEAYQWAKLLYLGILIAPIGIFETSRLISGSIKTFKFTAAAIVLHCGLALSLFTPWFIKGVRHIPFGYWAIPGPLFWVFFCSYSVLLGSPIVFLYGASRGPVSLHRTRTRALLLAIALVSLAGTNDLLPILAGNDDPRYPFVHWPFYPLGSITACIYMTIVAYSVLQHTLLDVHVAMGRVAAHLIRILFVTLSSFCFLLVVVAIAPARFTLFTFLVALITQMLGAVTASLLFPRLFGAASDSLGSRLLGDRFEYQDQVRNFIQVLKWYPDLGPLLTDFHTLLAKTFRVESYKMILRDSTGRAFQIIRAHPEPLPTDTYELEANSSLVDLAETERSAYISSLSLRSTNHTHVRVREEMTAFGATICFPLYSIEEPVGFLLLGKKLSAEPFTSTDVILLTQMAETMGPVLNQIRLKDHLLQTQELELLGRMSQGMAHDLNNLLTPISTLLQLTEESGEVDDELLPVATRNLGMIRAYIKDALHFSENLRPDIQSTRLDLAVHQAIDAAIRSRDKAVRITARIVENVVAELDTVLVQRLVANLVTNAVDASPESSEVVVTLERHPTIDRAREWLRLRVIDNGEGIPRENLERIFTPYFTTKNRDSRGRGFGLGLAICRKIATLHGGSLTIDSQVKKGTTVQLDLPSRQSPVESSPVLIPTAA